LEFGFQMARAVWLYFICKVVDLMDTVSWIYEDDVLIKHGV